MAIIKILQTVCNQCGEYVDDAHECEHCEHCGHDDLVEETFYGCNKCDTNMIYCNPFTVCPECGESAE